MGLAQRSLKREQGCEAYVTNVEMNGSKKIKITWVGKLIYRLTDLRLKE